MPKLVQALLPKGKRLLHVQRGTLRLEGCGLLRLEGTLRLEPLWRTLRAEGASVAIHCGDAASRSSLCGKTRQRGSDDAFIMPTTRLWREKKKNRKGVGAPDDAKGTLDLESATAPTLDAEGTLRRLRVTLQHGRSKTIA